MSTFRSRSRTERKIRMTQDLSCQVQEKKLCNYWAILYNWTTTDRIVLNNRPKGAMNRLCLSFPRYPALFWLRNDTCCTNIFAKYIFLLLLSLISASNFSS